MSGTTAGISESNQGANGFSRGPAGSSRSTGTQYQAPSHYLHERSREFLPPAPRLETCRGCGMTTYLLWDAGQRLCFTCDGRRSATDLPLTITQDVGMTVGMQTCTTCGTRILSGQICVACYVGHPTPLSMTQPSTAGNTQSSVDISQSTLNSVAGGQFNSGRDQIIFNLSDMSSESLVSVRGAGVIATISSANSSRSSLNYRSRRMSGDSSGADYLSDSRADTRDRARRQRIESEAKRREQLRDAYSELTRELPSSATGASKVAILKGAIGHIRRLKSVLQQMRTSLAKANEETARLRKINEELIMGAFEISGTNPLPSER